MSAASIAQRGPMFVSEKGGREGGGQGWGPTQLLVCVVLEQLEAMTGNTITIFM